MINWKQAAAEADADSVAVNWQDFTGRARSRLAPEPLYELMGRDPGAGLDRSAELVKTRPEKGSRIYRARLDLGEGEEELFIKLFDMARLSRLIKERMLSSRGIKKPWRYPLKLARLAAGKSLARRCWVMARACAESGIHTPHHLLYLSRGRGAGLYEVLVTRGVNPRCGPDLRHYINREFTPPNPPEAVARKRELLACLGRFLRKVADSDIMLPDFKLHNLVLGHDPAGRHRFFVVDLSEAEIRPSYPEYVFLERFSPHVLRSRAFTRSDYVRLMKSYLEEAGDPRGWRELCAGIEQRARKRGRRIASLDS